MTAVDRRAIIVSILSVGLTACAVHAADVRKDAVDFEGTQESLNSVLEAAAGGDLVKASSGLSSLWGCAKAKPRIRKVVDADGQTWGGSTGTPPPVERPTTPRPEQPAPRPAPPPRPDTRPLPPPLPPTVIPVTPGTGYPA